MTILDNLPHEVTVKRRIRTADSMGGSKDSFTTVTADVACWRQPASDSEMRDYEKRGVTVTDAFYFTSDPGVDERHTLVIGTETFEVRSFSVPDSSVGLGIVWKVMAERNTSN